MMRPLLRSRRFAAVVFLAATLLARWAPAQEAPAAPGRSSLQISLGRIDDQLRRHEWLKAAAAAHLLVEKIRTSLMGSDLAGVLARLALAKAGLGHQEDAIWYWHVAQNLDRSVLSAKELAAYGPPGELLNRHPLRPAGEAPAGLAVVPSDAREVTPGRLRDGTLPKLSLEVAALPVPNSLRLETVVDAEGRLREPVVIAGDVPGMIYEVLKALQGWRFEPARKGGEPVAVFWSLSLNPSLERPLSQVIPLGAFSSIEEPLRKGKLRQARETARRLWSSRLNTAPFVPQHLAAILALRALAEAGLGKKGEAICRWQVAQHLHPDLYDADLSPYGPAGELLEQNRWGEVRGTSLRTAEVKEQHKPTIPPIAFRHLAKAEVLLAVTVGADGAIRQPVFLQTEGSGETLQLMAASALDAVCDWRLRAVTSGAFQTVLTVPFKPPAMSIPVRSQPPQRIGQSPIYTPSGLPRRGRDVNPAAPIWGQSPGRPPA